MPQPKKAARFGGSPAHHNLILSNLATELFRHGRIRTTHAKAKTVQPLAERMITFAKRGDVHSRRQVLRVIRDKDVVHKLFATIGPAFAERNGGYTRVLKLDPRKGDAAPMALIELVEGAQVAEDDLAEAPTRRWSLRRRRGGTRSSGAATRELDRAAAADRGEDLEGVEEFEDAEAADAVPAGRLSEDDEAEVDEDAPQVTAAEVEARLAAEEDEESDEDEDDDAAAEADEADEDDDTKA